MIIPTHLHQQAAVQYLDNGYEFISQVGYGRVMTGRQIVFAKAGFLSVDDWFASLGTAGQNRVITFLETVVR